MKICVVGAGAIGGLLAVKLAASGQEVSVVIRGAHLAAVRAHGLQLTAADGITSVANLLATDVMAQCGVQDVVILGMKAHQLTAVAAQLPALFGPSTIVVSLQNGIPWWYFQRHGGMHEGRRVEAVDPGGVISAHIEPHRIIGSLAYPACELAAPGVIQHIEGNRFPLGEIDNSDTPRVRALAGALRDAGFKTPVTTDIRAEIWLKLWGNVSFNPISALTRATLQDMCEYGPTRDLARTMMQEAQAVGTALGVQFKVDIGKRMAGAQAVGAHKTSMLQDLEAGRPLELDALVKSVIELGKIAHVPTPTIAHVYALAAALAKTSVASKNT
jgi:2-dehydropantoate 2-reductase